MKAVDHAGNNGKALVFGGIMPVGVNFPFEDWMLLIICRNETGGLVLGVCEKKESFLSF